MAEKTYTIYLTCPVCGGKKQFLKQTEAHPEGEMVDCTNCNGTGVINAGVMVEK